MLGAEPAHQLTEHGTQITGEQRGVHDVAHKSEYTPEKTGKLYRCPVYFAAWRSST
jgi:hypothetical protein